MTALLAPLLLGIIARVKAILCARRGAPLTQPYHDLLKLLRKKRLRSHSTSWLFAAGAALQMAALLASLALLPLGPLPAGLSFRGDLFLLVALLAVGRAATVLAALDTGSAFEGMGASREVTFATLLEPALLLSLGALARLTGQASLSSIYAAVGAAAWRAYAPSLLAICLALLIVTLAENCRMPVDDPNTHLELTMIHEVMVLDHGGPDLALVQAAQALKLWVLGSLLVGLSPLRAANPGAELALFCAQLMLLAAVIGWLEATRARLRLTRVPQLLASASALALVALTLLLVATR